MNENGLLAAALVALGIAVPLPAFAAGMALALAGCVFVKSFRAVEAQRSWLLTLAMAAVLAVAVAMLPEPQSALFAWWGWFPVQVQMFLAGCISQSVFEVVASKGSGWLGSLANRAGLGGNKP